MSTTTVITQGFIRPVGLRVLPAANQVIVAQRNGQLFAVDLTTAQSTQVGAVSGRVNAFDVTPDGQIAYVSGNSLGVWEVSLNGGENRRLVRGLAQPMGVTLDSEGMLLVAEGRAPGRLISINPNPVEAVLRHAG